MKKVLAGGRFNIIHDGHVHFLKEAKALGDFLIVVVANDETVSRERKSACENHFKRRKRIESLGFVDKVLIGHPRDIMKTVEKVRPDIIAIGHDQKVDAGMLEKELRRRGIRCTVRRISRLSGFKTTDIMNKRNKIKENSST